ncbi:MutS-related protein [Mycolicibacter icosiumassiliensis]|uniref:MutS-related protein n=1 Tax=Mycolicibacter icosiumassiliensis TaxID=1792835 RepID=UPI00082EE898|nr:DNA mismatch repair protein MutS [Mycolicibacter icosiumassiliensis]
MTNSGGFASILSTDEMAFDDVTRPECFDDLYLDQIIAGVTFGHADEGLEPFFYVPLQDTATVRYRQDIFRDLERPEVQQPIENFVAGMRTTRQRLEQSAHLWHPLQQQGWFIYAAEAYCDAVEILHNELAQINPVSRGLRDFADFLAGYVHGNGFRVLVTDTHNVRDRLREVRYAVHIDGLRVHVERYTGQTDYTAQVIAVFERFVSQEAKDYRIDLQQYPDMNHVEEQILEHVANLYPDQFGQLDRFCADNAAFFEPTVARFDREIPFYLCYLSLMERFTAAGLEFSYPDVTSEPGVIDVDDAFDLALAIKLIDDNTPFVRNNFALSGPERIFVITGPNQGGKTTFARTVGQCLYLATLGCPVPARAARLTLPDQIYTHFERQETLATLHGKLDDELVRIHDILSRATAASVVVMNESFASTTACDALQIGVEVLTRMIKLGCIAVYVTFLDELAGFDPVCVSMVGEVAHDDPTRRTFRFTRRPADGLAYAAALADKYGLNHDALLRRVTR